MPSSLRMQGVQAAVEYGYHVAAELGAWELHDGFLRAYVHSCDAFRMTQTPLYFTVDNSASGRPPFQRQLLDAQVTGTWLTGRLGPRKG
jgi:hypothetical protein